MSSSSPSTVSRDWELKTAANGAHYAIGGKITSSRQDAACIVDTVCAQLDVSQPCATEHNRFPWAPQEAFPAWFAAMQSRAAQLGIDPDSAKWLLCRHGTQTTGIFHSIEADRSLAQRIAPALPFIVADLLHCATNEMVVHLDDLLRRRLPLLILTKLTQDQLRRITLQVAAALQWDDKRLQDEMERCTPWITH